MKPFVQNLAISLFIICGLIGCTTYNVPGTALFPQIFERPTVFSAPKIPRNHQSCIQNLINQGVSFTIVPNDTKGHCTIPQQLVLDQSLFPYKGTGSVRGTCALMTAVFHWEKHVVQPAAARHLSSPVAQIREMGNFSCRTIAGTRRPSEHSKANAIDIGGFTLKNGREISVLRDMRKNTPEGRFLREVYQGSCRVFNGVLGPNYNKAHQDHLHLDMGPYKMCE